MKECTCHELLGSLGLYLDGEAEAALCSEIEAHLAECPHCRVEVDTMRKTITWVHDVPKPELPADARQRLMYVLQLEDKRSKNDSDSKI
jgi:anti-sigma factor RsiW